MDRQGRSGAPEIKVFSEAEYRADPANVIAHAEIEGRVIVARADGSPRFMIVIPPPEHSDPDPEVRASIRNAFA